MRCEPHPSGAVRLDSMGMCRCICLLLALLLFLFQQAYTALTTGDLWASSVNLIMRAQPLTSNQSSHPLAHAESGQPTKGPAPRRPASTSRRPRPAAKPRREQHRAASRPWHAQDARSTDDKIPCKPGVNGTFLLGLEATPFRAEVKCSMRARDQTELCNDNYIVVTTPAADNCTGFAVSKVESCGPTDLKCKHYNCRGLGVQRLETLAGELVSSGSRDQMLTCGNIKFEIVWEAFCPYEDLSCAGGAAWAQTTTAAAL